MTKSPDFFYDLTEGKKHSHKWGYLDTRFEFDGPRSVRVTGNRYPLSGFSLPSLIPFIEEVVGVSIRQEDIKAEVKDIQLPEPKLNKAFLDSIKTRFNRNQISFDSKNRLIHSHGQLSVDEIYRVVYGNFSGKIIDLILYPENSSDVKDIIQLANEYDVCLIPYGGGTNVSGALVCPSEDQRMMVSVDLSRMNRILWIDQENFQACVESGISGKQLEIALDKKGFTSGHDPDSVEFSTLGGWISTNASGMKKNKYGNIEDIVLEATLVTPTGDIETKILTPRTSTGIQPRSFFFGSEGNFGIITQAVIKIHPKPRVCQYGSLVFPSFKLGVHFLKRLSQSGILPASIRLVNNSEFRFGQALKPKATFLRRIKDQFQKFILMSIFRFNPKKIVACTIVMEGSKSEVQQQKKTIFSLAKRFKGKNGGASNGKRGYMLTFGIAYIRDFLSQFHILGETFETSVPWNKIHQVCRAVEKELAEQVSIFQIPGKPYLAYRLTQIYHTGVCIYFTMGFSGKGLDDPEEVYHTIEGCLRQAILDNGGSLSHHHGIGKVRQKFLTQVQSENSIHVLRQTKKAIDPNNIFGIQNGVFYQSSDIKNNQ